MGFCGQTQEAVTSGVFLATSDVLLAREPVVFPIPLGLLPTSPGGLLI